MSDVSPDSAFATSADEALALRFGMWVFLASEAMLFGAIFTVYALSRIDHGAAFGAASSRLMWQAGAANTAILLASSWLVALAVEATRTHAWRFAFRALAGAVVLGVIFLAIKGWEWSQEIGEGLFPAPGHFTGCSGPDQPGAELFFRVYFTATGLHALHLLMGLLAIGWVLATWRGRRAQPELHAVTSVGLYWHFVDVIWIFLFPLLYLVHRS